MPGLDFFPTATNACALLEGVPTKGAPCRGLCLCSRGVGTKHGHVSELPAQGILVALVAGWMGNVRSLSSLAEVACFCSFQLGPECSFAEAKGPFPILDRAT